MLVVRAWVESGSEKSLRATIRRTADIAARFDEQAITVADVDSVAVVVRQWLEEILAVDG